MRRGHFRTVRLMLAAVASATEPMAAMDLAALLNGATATVARGALHKVKRSNLPHCLIPRIDP
jgi:hypothetical protein